MHVGLFAEVDPNLIEGPAIWLVSVAEALVGQGHRVTVLLRARRVRGEVLAPLDALDGVRLVDPFAAGWTDEAERPMLSVARAADLLERLDGESAFDAVLVRGASAAAAMARRSRFARRLALYLTDLPHGTGVPGWWARIRFRRAVGAASLLLCQTPEIADRLGRMTRPSAPPLALLPPIVGEAAFALGPACPPGPGEALRLVYIGKFAPAWNTLEMTALPALLAESGVPAQLHVAGDKFLSRPDPDFPARMRAALSAPGVVWHGGLARRGALRLAGASHVGLSWRAADLDGSPELSTKLLEYGALGLPVVCNPTAMHRRLLGADYPLFASTRAEVLAALRRVGDAPTWRRATAATRALAERHRMAPVGASLSAALRRAFG